MYRTEFSGKTLEFNGTDYPAANSDEHVIQCVTHGELLYLNDDYEIWLHEGFVAVVLNLVGVLE